MHRIVAGALLVVACAIFAIAMTSPAGKRPAHARLVAKATPGADPLAPAGAPVTWLPNEQWVQQRWLPYPEAALYRELGAGREELRLWLRRRPLAALAQRRHLRVGDLVTALVAPWRGHVPARQYATLHERALRTFTQRHLMQHMLFHTFHVQALSRALPAILGRPAAGYGTSLASQAQRHGRTVAQVERGTLAVLRAAAMRGVRLHAMPAVQARAQAAQARAAVAGQLQYTRALARQPSGP